MHLTLKRENAAFEANHILGQQEVFEHWKADFNERRPHEALGMKTPSELYKPSPRPYTDDLPDPEYPHCDKAVMVDKSGKIWIPQTKRMTFITKALAHQIVGLKEQEDDLWEVKFMDLTLGIYNVFEGVFHRGDM
jgi:hypothetical protein